MKKVNLTIGILALAAVLSLNVRNAVNGYGVANAVNAQGTISRIITFFFGDSSSTGKGTNKVKVVDTKSELRATVSFKYKTKLGAIVSVTKGAILGAELGVYPEVEANTEWADSYRVNCFEGGKIACVPTNWVFCASSGCPQSGTFGQK